MATLGVASVQTSPSDRERGELIRGLYRHIPVVVLCMFFGAFATCVGMVYLAPDRRPQIEAWFAISVAVAAWQLGLWAWRGKAGIADADWRVWARRLILASFADGVRWGFATLWLAAGGAADQMMWVCMVAGGAACASVAALGSYYPAYYALLFPAIVPYMLRAMTLNDPRYWGVALLGGVVLIGMAWLGRLQSRTLAGALRLRFENLDLAEDLRRQRDLAEQANLAKARFLAAASHDLRQPMHALGMFAAALGRGRLRAEDAGLVDRIQETVEAMDGLFESLLDISQLDAGATQPQVRAVPIQPLLARICAEQAAEIRDRPIRLRTVACGATVATDPVLLERMLRNLVSNAVRHTGSGRVLVGCRRRGARLTVEVWDTGPGIAPDQQARVFEEFVQLANPERDRANGLGLGLAITRRLGDLLDCPVTLSSEPGRGSMFAVSVPLASAAAVPPVADAAPALIAGGVVFVVDDDALVRESTARLLTAWGYDVVTGGSAEAALAAARRRTPDLIVCDWRLRNGETAPDAIARIRAAGDGEAPVLIITGDIGADQLRAIHATGFSLLHKPVAPARLRAAVGNLIRERAVAETAAAAG
ncbi:hybrid sensor histidine kinase/response regulator [Phenylobacterium sp.]|uniref:ATP-binding response regulator n=1 Tax=Phenylobacterium sp. TaxID=1871053 RepID=UPI0025DE8CE1|nr:hybrid sensor histidine kinase/response regulator [Phenylobacterium sp.]MBX3482651.1 hybrid sensor histidine kinase/response regulator [Phenylobacterium sp.]